MPGPQLECVPNVSEGRHMAHIEAMTAAIANTPGVRLLHRDIGYDANRTVFTFLGPDEAVLAAAQNLARAALELIDLRHYSGTHPFIGALDVCPFVPLWGFDESRALEAADRMGHFLAEQLRIPVYFYEHSSRRPTFRSLAACRKGGLSAIPNRPADSLPDLGGAIPHPSAGVSVVGMRSILVAYNINMPGASLSQVRALAASLRKMPAVRAIGWLQPSYGLAQVSINLLNYQVTGLAEVYEKLKELAVEMGLEPGGSELIGMLPEDALTRAARYYEPGELSLKQAVALAVDKLGLDALRPFHAGERILEWRLAQ